MAQVGSIRGLSVRSPSVRSMRAQERAHSHFHLMQLHVRCFAGAAVRCCAARRHARQGCTVGVQQYIKKIRAASTQEERENIVFKELAKIRQKYSSAKKVSRAFWSLSPALRLLQLPQPCLLKDPPCLLHPALSVLVHHTHRCKHAGQVWTHAQMLLYAWSNAPPRRAQAHDAMQRTLLITRASALPICVQRTTERSTHGSCCTHT
jgi:hypothetical protein